MGKFGKLGFELFRPGLLRTHFPYVLLLFEGDIKHKKEGYFILNRYYSGLGTPSQDLRNAMPVHLSKKEEKRLRECCPYGTSGGIWLYDDLTTPWENKENFKVYMNKLEVLASCTFFKEEGQYEPWYVDEKEIISGSQHSLPHPKHGFERAFYELEEEL